jgi:hypothetical protein
LSYGGVGQNLKIWKAGSFESRKFGQALRGFGSNRLSGLYFLLSPFPAIPVFPKASSEIRTHDLFFTKELLYH